MRKADASERESLRQRATALCDSFAERKSVEEVLENFSEDVVCLEHGLQELAPFLGRTYVGLDGAKCYFQMIHDLLDFQNMKFSDFMVDTEARQVSVRGEATFIWKSTQHAWDEVFTYRLTFSPDQNKISSYEVWADSGAAYLARKGQLHQKVVLITYEFTYSPFSGNGILARSIVKSLLELGCDITVWCCEPHEDNSSKDNHLQPPEITIEEHERLQLIPVQLDKNHGWRKLDDESAWQQFCFSTLTIQQQALLTDRITNANIVCAIDWTGAYAFRSIQKIVSAKLPPLVYMNFRVYSSGVADCARQAWFNDMERQALQGAAYMVALSERDRSSLEQIAGQTLDNIKVLLPPLRGDVHRSAHLSIEELDLHLPESVATALKGDKGRRLISCVARISKEKNVMRFVRFVEKANFDKMGLIPLLAGASTDTEYAANVRDQLLRAAPNSIVVDTFLSPDSLSAIFSHTALNVHPCAYDAYGMTIVEAAACGAPSVLARDDAIGASALIQSSLQVEMPNDENELGEGSVEAIIELLENSDQLLQMGMDAKRTALEWDEVAYGRKLLTIFRETVCTKHDMTEKSGNSPPP